MTKKGRQLFLAKKCTPDKILATPCLNVTFIKQITPFFLGHVGFNFGIVC